MGASIGDPHRTVGGDDLRLEEPRRRQAVGLREAPEAAALNQPGDADRRAAPALNVAPSFGGHALVDGHPGGAGLDRHGGLRDLGSLTPRAHERVVQSDPVHRAGPDQQRIRGAGGSLIAVTAAFHDQAEAVGAGEVDRRDHVRRLPGGDGIDARRRRPSVDPAGGLRQPRLVTEVVRVLQPPHDLDARRAPGHRPTRGQGRLHGIRRPPTSRLRRSQLAADGHDGSPGRTRCPRPPGIPLVAKPVVDGEQPTGSTPIAAAPLRRSRRFTGGGPGRPARSVSHRCPGAAHPTRWPTFAHLRHITMSSVWFASTPPISFALTALAHFPTSPRIGSYSRSAASEFLHGFFVM